MDRVLSLGLWAVLLLGVSGCSSKHEARTPQEFIEKYSAAWKKEDVTTIFDMQKRKDLDAVDVSPTLRESLAKALLEDEKSEIEQSIQHRDFGYVAWTHTTFIGAREHEDHIHVDVAVDNARSEVILVREGEVLKIHPNPSRFK